MNLLTLQILAISTSLLAWTAISSSCFILLHSHNKKKNIALTTMSIFIILWIINTYILYKSFVLCQSISAISALTVSYVSEIVYNLVTIFLGGYIIWDKYLSLRFKHKFDLSFLNITNRPTTIPISVKKAAELSEKQIKQIHFWLNNPETYKSKITLKMIAKDVLIAPSVLSAFIKKEFGVSFSEYVNNLRLDDVEDSLLDKEQETKTITELFEETGFQCPSSFYRNFEKRHQLSPLKWKELRTTNTDKESDS